MRLHWVFVAFATALPLTDQLYSELVIEEPHALSVRGDDHMAVPTDISLVASGIAVADSAGKDGGSQGGSSIVNKKGAGAGAGAGGRGGIAGGGSKGGGSKGGGSKGGGSKGDQGGTNRGSAPASKNGDGFGNKGRDYAAQKDPPPPYSLRDSNGAPPPYTPRNGVPPPPNPPPAGRVNYGQRGTTPTYWNGMYYPYASYGYGGFFPVGVFAPLMLAGPFGFYGHYCDSGNRGGDCTTSSMYVNGTQDSDENLVNGTYYSLRWLNGQYEIVSNVTNVVYTNYTLVDGQSDIAVNGTIIGDEDALHHAVINPNVTSNGTVLDYGNNNAGNKLRVDSTVLSCTLLVSVLIVVDSFYT